MRTRAPLVAGARGYSAKEGAACTFCLGIQRFSSYFLAMNSFTARGFWGSGSGYSWGVHVASQWSRATLLPPALSFSTSSGLKKVMETDLTRWLKSRLIQVSEQAPLSEQRVER